MPWPLCAGSYHEPLWQAAICPLVGSNALAGVVRRSIGMLPLLYPGKLEVQVAVPRPLVLKLSTRSPHGWICAEPGTKRGGKSAPLVIDSGMRAPLPLGLPTPISHCGLPSR